MIQKKKEQKALGRKKPRFDPLEAHTFEQDETMEDHIVFSIRRGLIVPWGNSRFGYFLSTCAYDVSNTTRLEGKLTAEALLKKCKIPKSFFVSHFPSVHGKLEKVVLEYAHVALSTMEEEERFLPYKRPPRGDKLAKVTMQDLVGKGGWAAVTIEGNHLFCYELAANADPRWQEKPVELG
eukprot:g9038.t1